MWKRILTFILLLLLVLMLLGAQASPVWAQEGRISSVSEEIMLFTPYPAQEVALDESISMELTLRAGTSPQNVRLNVEELPEGWTASFKGEGRNIEAAYVEPENDTKVDLRVDPPANAEAGTYRFTVVAQGEAGTAELPIELEVKEKLPANLALEVELPTLKGKPDTTFRYNVTLKNEGDEDLTVNLLAETPPGVVVGFKLSGQEVTNLPLAAGESKNLNVEAEVFPEMPAGTYPIEVLVQGGEAEATASLAAEVVGQAELSVTAPDGRLSGEAYAGDTTPIKLIVQNTGSAPARNITLSASQPNGWSVEFEPKQLQEVPAGKQVEVTANIQPAEQAVAGDYMVTLRTQSEDAPSESAEFRITVLTSTLWGIVGIGLIAVAVVVVGLAVMRFGRR
jgi:uncharacterized membrane protein